MKGKFITFEGCEGAGKSKQIKLLCEYFDKNSIPYVLTREPGGASISEKIRAVILDAENKDMCDETEALLFAAARAQHVRTVIKPNLEKGVNVLCDRYVDSSYAYQAYAKGLTFEYIEGIGCVSSGNYFNLITPLAVPTCRFENNLVCISKNGQLLYSEEKEKQKRFGVACKCLSASAENPETDIEVITAPTQTIQKIIRDGQLYIIKDGKMYNVMGVEVDNVDF